MLRGKNIELLMGKVIDVLRSKGYFAIKLYPKRTHNGDYIEGEPFDYLIIKNGKVIAFDTKEAKKEKWYIGNAKLSQIKFLRMIKKNGGEAFFLVYFYPYEKFIKYDIDLIINTDEKFLTPGKGEVWELKTFLNS